MLKSFIKLLIPYIFYPWVFKDIINKIFFKNKIKHHFNFESQEVLQTELR